MLNEDFSRLVIAEREREFAQRAKHRTDETPALAVPAESVVLRLCRVDDDPALEVLAVLSGGRVVDGRYVLAEVDGTIVAGLPLEGGEPITDPFRSTAQLLPLLQLRADQLTKPARSGWFLTRFGLAPARH
jgi:hypothetical protein